MRQDVPERNMVEEYDTATDQWLIRAPMPTPRSATAWGIFNGRIYVAGGEIRHRDCGMPNPYNPARTCRAYNGDGST